MKTNNIVLLIGLLFYIISCNQGTSRQAETTNNEIIIEQNDDLQQSKEDAQTAEYIPVYCSEDESTYCNLTGNDSEITQFPLNNSYSIRIREISESEFTARRRESRHLQHQNNYEVITDRAEVQKLLGDRVRGVDKAGVSFYRGIEVVHNDGTTKVHDIHWVDWGVYYPELGVLIVSDASENLGFAIDLNDSERTWRQVGFPEYHSLSPGRQWRLNGHPVGGFGHVLFFLEKWSPRTNRFEFVGHLPSIDEIMFSTIRIWESNNKLLFRVGWRQEFYEMEIIANEKR